MATAKKAAAKKTPAKKSSAKSAAKKTQTPRGRAQDRRLVAGKQKHEVAYEAKKEGVSPGIVAEVVKVIGNSRRKVEAALESFKSEKKPARKAKS